VLAEFTGPELVALESDWRFYARPSQLPPPGPWTVWLRMAGRGEGKTWTGANWSHEQAKAQPGSIGHLVAPTAADTRDVMVQGPSGILATAPPGFRPVYHPSNRRLDWPNGSSALLFSADEPERLRGPQCAWGWADEVAAWRYAESWDQLLFGLRMGAQPRLVVTTTPKPVRVLREILSRADTVVSRGRTADNRANLAPTFLTTVVAKYEGTRLGRQELDGELLEDMPGALWTRTRIDSSRVAAAPALRRVVVGIDPAASSNERSDETGIVVAGLGTDGHGYILADGSGRYAPLAWARQALALYATHGGDRLVAEVNNGGEMVTQTIHTVQAGAPVKAVHASRGKRTRAEPISALYEQGKVHHVGTFPDLEDQMCTWIPDVTEDSPDRMDALVWALTELMVGPAFVMA
jgi:phage terminase large subunit-like protein